MKVKLIGFFARFLGAGSAVKKAQGFFDGKKATMAALALAIPNTLAVLVKFATAEDGLKYLTGAANEPEFLAANAGWWAFFQSLKGEKIRNENAEILKELQASPSVTIESKS